MDLIFVLSLQHSTALFCLCFMFNISACIALGGGLLYGQGALYFRRAVALPSLPYGVVRGSCSLRDRCSIWGKSLV
ncbi:hypothetical protein BJ508DRAFT_51606 [Ascobolus immersus RN42]|uniref:Uncharacterized protein n=1 Tax=Ascobolus immersus RN42 TaxID=1160509 RepID=A0A3N4II59_ASCIM|nr:hypothetical protein BJ508DRAFT_51606 [Ascobolus immersus RN42]